jgi:hypothetical protein
MFKRHKPYDRTTHDGNTVNWRTKAMLLETEDKLGYKLTVLQGSYNPGGVGSSAGTHDGGGVVDLSAYDNVKKLRALKNVGFAAFYRPQNWDGRGGIAHIHAVAKGDNELASLAALQAQYFDQGRDGLGPVPFGPDNTYRPKPPVVFDYFKWQRERLSLNKMLKRLKALMRRRENLNDNIDDLRKKIKNHKH